MLALVYQAVLDAAGAAELIVGIIIGAVAAYEPLRSATVTLAPPQVTEFSSLFGERMVPAYPTRTYFSEPQL